MAASLPRGRSGSGRQCRLPSLVGRGLWTRRATYRPRRCAEEALLRREAAQGAKRLSARAKRSDRKGPRGTDRCEKACHAKRTRPNAIFRLWRNAPKKAKLSEGRFGEAEPEGCVSIRARDVSVAGLSRADVPLGRYGAHVDRQPKQANHNTTGRLAERALPRVRI